MTILRVLNLVAWAALAAYMIPGAWSALFGRAQRRGDAMRLGVLATSMLIFGFNTRSLMAPDNDGLLQVLLVMSLGTAGGIFWLAWSYGRGPRV